MQRFFEKIGQGGDVRQRAEAAAGVPLHKLVEMDLQSADGHLTRLINFAAKEGHSFTRDELVNAFRQQVADIKQKGGNGELSDSDLAAVAGGGPEGWFVGAVVGGLIGGAVAGAGTLGWAAAGGAVVGAPLGGDIVSNFQDFATKKWGNW
jgi:hypothetical protein